MADDAVDDVTVVRDEGVYALVLGDRRIGGAFFTTDGTTLTFTHTEVDDEFAGQHLGAKLVRAALDDVRVRGEKVIAICPFVAAYIERHADYADLLVTSL